MFEQAVKRTGGGGTAGITALLLAEVKDSRARVRRLLFRVATGPAVLTTLRGLSVEPGRPAYPIRWTSAKQRRYVMMKLRRERNLPYMRTHRQSQGWTATVGEGMTILFTNRSPAADFVQGRRQQVMHKGRWPDAQKVIGENATAILNETADQYWRSFGRKA